MALRKTVLTEAAIPVALARPAVPAEGRRVPGIRTLTFTALLFLLPVLTYWPATFHQYGLRDDYSNIREAHEEPGRIVQFCASHARPIYGLLLQSSFSLTDTVQNLQWLRLLAALLLGALSLVTFRGLRTLGWTFGASLLTAVLVGLLPSAQVIAGWAIGWPYALAALLAVGGFFTVDGALGYSGRVNAGPSSARRAALQWSVALGLMVVSALTYQPSTLFYAVPLAAALIAQRRRTAAQCARWAATHVGFVTASMGIAYGIMSVLYANHVFVKSGRVAFEHHWAEKFAWFLREPLPNALSLFVVNDNNGRDRPLYLACAMLAALLLAAGAWLEWRRRGRSRGLIWLCGLVALPTFAFGASLVASERYATYRTIFAMSAVLLCFLVASLLALLERRGPIFRGVLVGLMLAAAWVTAQHHVYALIAVPQGNEWQLIMAGAKQVQLDPAGTDVNHKPRVFAIASAPADISTATIYHDEFGSLSSNSEWVPKEMFKRAMHDLHPDVFDLEHRYVFATGPRTPADQRFDIIIDLHRLRRFRTEN